MRRSRARRLAGAVPRAVVLGFATLFQPKARPDDHWSVTPQVQVVEEAAEEGSGAPPTPKRLRSIDATPRTVPDLG